MTSKSLFIKLQREDLKRRIWTIALSMLVFFISIPIICTMLLGSYNVSDDNNRWITEQLIEYMGIHNIFVILTTIVGAIICGLSSFFYLHSKKKVDLYHSVPIRRETLFTISYINGILIYIIPYVINVVLCFIILQINQRMNMDIFTAALSAIGLNLLFYCMIYTIVIIAVMLTGNLVISFFGTAVLLLYGPMIMVLKEMYFMKFFRNYYGRSNFDDLFLFLSPIGIYLKRVDSGSTSGSMLAVFVTTILLIAFALFLYKKRSSEAAGKSMAFGFSKPIIKFLLVVPLTLGGGIIFKEIAHRSSNGWYIFGLIFSLILIYAIIEIIYNFDIRSAFKYKRQMVACAGIVAIIAVIFQFDLLQYDSYIPKKSKVESMSIAISGLDENNEYFEIDNNSRYIDYTSYQLKYMELTDIESAYELAELGKDNDYNSMGSNNFYYNVKFKLKNGREVFRVYQLNKDETLDVVKELYVSKEFKKAHFPIYQWDIDRIYKISCYNMFDNKEFGLDMDAKKKLVDIYKEELMNLTIDEVANTSPMATLSFQVHNNYSNYYIYPSFEKTIAFIKEYGFDATKEVKMKDIKEIEVTNYKVLVQDTMNEIAENEISSSTYDYKTNTYTKEQDLSKIYTNLIEQQYYWSNRSIIKTEENVDITVVIRKDEYGNEGRYSYYFKQGQIPDFVKEDVNISAE